jgi:hypothetical protein
VPDPVEIPCIAITEEDGQQLLRCLEEYGPGHISSFKEYDSDRRAALLPERWGNGTVFLHIEGLELQTVDWECPLSSVGTVGGRQPSTYEDFYKLYVDRKDVDKRLSPEFSKLRRIFESAWTQMRRTGTTHNPAMLGKLLALAGQKCSFSVQYVRFNRGKANPHLTTCTMLLSGCHSSRDSSSGRLSIEDSLAWVAHESVYLALLSHFTKLIGFIAPSLWNFIKCTNGEFFGWEADANKIVKLFTPCTGPVGPAPKEAWQRRDPTWCIVDTKNKLGMVTESQGRLLWRADSASTTTVSGSGESIAGALTTKGAFYDQTSSTRRTEGDSAGRAFSRALAWWSTKICCTQVSSVRHGAH